MVDKTTGTTTDKTTLVVGDKVFLIDSVSGSWRDVDIKDILGFLPRSATGLRVTRPTAATIRLRGTDAVLKDSGGGSYRTGPFDVTLDISAAAGAGALDESTEANSTWYTAFLIYNGTTVSGVLAKAQRLSGTTTSTTASKLVDSGATFVTDNIQVGAWIHNTTDDTVTRVSAVDSETTLSVEDDIFATTEGYTISNERPELPSGYTFWSCPMTFVYNDPSGNLVDYKQYGNRVDFQARRSVAGSLSSTSYATQDLTTALPIVSGRVQDALFGATGAASCNVWLSDDGTNAKTIFAALNTDSGVGGTDELYDKTFASPCFVPLADSNIYYKVNASNITLYARAFHLTLPIT